MTRKIPKNALGESSKNALGESSILASCVFFAMGAVLIKSVSREIGILFISCSNFMFGLLIGAVMLLCTRRGIVIHDAKYLVLRGIFGAIAMTFNFMAIHLTNSGRATLLNTTFPLFSAILGYLFFQETLTLSSVTGLLLCMVGACFVFFDKFGGGMIRKLVHK